jgi:hypothetical protein
VQPLCYHQRIALTIAIGFLIQTACATSLLAQEPAPPPPERDSLPIELRPQETELWCWAATGQMTMEYLGKSVSQSEQANKLLRRTDCEQRPVPKPCIHGGLVLIPEYGFVCDFIKSPPTEREIERQIHTLRKPIPFAWKWKGGGGHIGLVIGYVRGKKEGSSFVEVLDPFPPPGKHPQNSRGGQHLFVPYKKWAGGSAESTFDHALINIVEKK